MAAVALMLGGVMTASAQGTVDKTSSVAAWTGANYTSGTDGVVLNENYASSTTTTGNIFSQEITGLEAGYYKLSLYANAIYTPERGFTSDAADFDADRVFIFATGNGVTNKTAVPVKYGIITSGSELYTVNATVGDDGKLTIGMVKDKVGTNWHTIATKSLIYYGNDLTAIKADLSAEITTASGLSVASTETESLNAAIEEAQAVYDSSTATFDEVDAAITTLKIAEKFAQGGFSSATLDNPVLTDFVVNGDFTSFTNNWPNGGWYTTAGVGNHGQMTEGSEKAWENYSWGNERLSGKMYFRMNDIPNGAYSVSIDGFSRTAASTYVYANKERVYLSANETYETKVIPVIVKNNMLEVGEYSGKIDWMKIKNVKVSYTGDPLASYKKTIKDLIETGEALDLTGIPAAVADPLTSAISSYKTAYASYTEEEECTTAISALQPAIEKVLAYIKAKATVDKIQALLDGTNVYTTDAYNTFYAYVTKFENAEYSTEEAIALEGVIFGTGWRSNAAVDDFLISAWDVTARNWDSYHVNTWSTIGDSGNPNFVKPCIEYWTNDASILADKVMTASFSDLNPGSEYKVTAIICIGINTGADAATDPTGVSLQINDGEATACVGTQIAATRFHEGTFEATGTIGFDGKLNIKINVASTNASWITFRNVKYEKTADAVAPTEAEVAALNEAIEAAEAYTLGFEADEYAPYNNVAGLEALANAQDVKENAIEWQSAVVAATEALAAATWTANTAEVNAIYDGDFAIHEAYEEGSANTVLPGWNTVSGNIRRVLKTVASYPGLAEASAGAAVFTHAGNYQYGNTVGYSVPLKANTVYAFSIKVAGWNNEERKDVSVSVLNGEDGLPVTNLGVATKDIVGNDNNVAGFTEYTKVFKTGAAGNYVLSYMPMNNASFTDVVLKKAGTEEVTVTSAGLATYVSDYDLDFTGLDVKAYKAKVTGTDIVFTQVYEVPAGQGVLLRGEGTFEVPVTVGVAALEDNDFIRGTGEAVASNNEDGTCNYILNVVDGVVGFYKANNQTVATNRAYLKSTTATEGATRMGFRFDDETTGIESVATDVENTTIYNLNGMRVAQPQKGLYIQNGKKVVVK